MVDLPERQRDSRDLSDRGRRQDEHRKTRGYDVTERRGNPRQGDLTMQIMQMTLGIAVGGGGGWYNSTSADVGLVPLL
eukprot:CAMPEP_0119563598 /NCGR_PEP_ID=MMETSP1352-20130426/23970_1 /TAXON_ID=265584 /ORGANISM="Stauroneis constricta, Strain CCMP1120" /LENGTH=77 /DNA_ID=CAMNT_0007612223 /DNA_START=32 /DNA_END=261 /DNA_ORIENTATION=+